MKTELSHFTIPLTTLVFFPRGIQWSLRFRIWPLLLETEPRWWFWLVDKTRKYAHTRDWTIHWSHPPQPIRPLPISRWVLPTDNWTHCPNCRTSFPLLQQRLQSKCSLAFYVFNSLKPRMSLYLHYIQYNTMESKTKQYTGMIIVKFSWTWPVVDAFCFLFICYYFLFFSKKTMSESLTSVVQTYNNFWKPFAEVYNSIFACLWKYNLNRLTKFNPINWLRKNKLLK